ncbi:MAG: PIN domain-containing protein [Gemmatimonadota bacterium]
MGLVDDLAAPIAIDTAIIIYLIEQNEGFLPAIRPLFKAADRGDIELVTSEVTLLEVLVGPYRAGDADLAARYEALLTRSRGLTLVALSRPVIRAAAQLRATRAIRTPDALQLAAALSRRCGSFLTNDRRIPSLPGLPVVQVSDRV